MEKSQLTGELMAGHTPHSRFARHARGVGVLWGVFSVCFCIIVIVVFIQPHWIGSPRDSQPGHMGLWRWCYASSDTPGDVSCVGNLLEVDTFTTGLLANNTILLVTTILTALSVVVTVLSLILMLLFLCFNANRVFHIIGWIQILAGCLLGAAVCVYPLGFSSSEVLRMCGPTARQYNVGECSIRWAYVLAIIGVFDAIVLAALALVLATRRVKPASSESIYNANEFYKGGEYSDAISIAASRKSLNLQPMMMMPNGEDTYGRHPPSHHYHL